MPKSLLTFTAKLKSDFPFLVDVRDDPHSAFCTFCNKKISISNGGRSDINQHDSSLKHRKAAETVATSRPINQLLIDTQSPAVMVLQAQEVTFAYHYGRHRMSGRTSACTSDLISKCFSPKFTDGVTKVAKLITKVHPIFLYLLHKFIFNLLTGYFPQDRVRDDASAR